MKKKNKENQSYLCKRKKMKIGESWRNKRTKKIRSEKWNTFGDFSESRKRKILIIEEN